MGPVTVLMRSRRAMAVVLLFCSPRCPDATGNLRGHHTYGPGALASLASSAGGGADGSAELDSVWLSVLRRDLQLAMRASQSFAQGRGARACVMLVFI